MGENDSASFFNPINRYDIRLTRLRRPKGAQFREEYSSRCPTGEARITLGFRLPARHIIHTVGPIWRGGNANEPELLRNCYLNSLRVAVEYDLKSIAFPAISCGVYGYPIDAATRIAFDTIYQFLAGNDSLSLVWLVAFEKNVFDTLQANCH